MAQHKRPTKSVWAFRYQYAVKVLCTSTLPGTSQTADSLPAGHYSTVINIHNPNSVRVKLRMKIAVAGSKPSEFIEKIVGPDFAVKLGCEQVTRDFGVTFIHGAEGFVVIESPQSLDVTAVYTAARLSGEVVGLDVEPVRERVFS